MAFTFLKAQGYEIGKSLVEDDLLDEARTIMIKARKRGVRFYLPIDVVVAKEFNENATAKYLPAKRYQKIGWGLILVLLVQGYLGEVLNDGLGTN